MLDSAKVYSGWGNFYFYPSKRETWQPKTSVRRNFALAGLISSTHGTLLFTIGAINCAMLIKFVRLCDYFFSALMADVGIISTTSLIATYREPQSKAMVKWAWNGIPQNFQSASLARSYSANFVEVLPWLDKQNRFQELAAFYGTLCCVCEWFIKTTLINAN